MNRTVDNIILYRILKLLATPIARSDAYKLGIIDNKGKQIKVPISMKEKDSFTLLNRLVFRIQGMIMRNNPRGETELKKIATGTFLIKECYESKQEPLNLELLYNRAMDIITEEDIKEFENILDNTIIPFSVFSEDAPLNNSMNTPGIENPETFLRNNIIMTRNLKRKKKGKEKKDGY